MSQLHHYRETPLQLIPASLARCPLPPRRFGKVLQKGVKVFAVRDDLEARGINREGCLDGVQMIRGKDVASLLEDFEQVWHW